LKRLLLSEIKIPRPESDSIFGLTRRAAQRR